MAPDDGDKLRRALFNVSPDSLVPGEPSLAYLQQHKLYLERQDKLADRRQSVNSFFLTLNTGVCAVLAFFFSKDTFLKMETSKLVCIIIVPIAGIVISVFWYRLARSYQQLAKGKFSVLHEIEKYLPLAPYAAEWTCLGKGDNPRLYRPITQTEIWIPRLFALIYVVTLITMIIFFVPWAKVGEVLMSILVWSP